MRKCRLLIFLFLVSLTVHAKSLIDTSKNLISPESSLVDTSKNLVDESNTLITKEKNLVDESKTLVDETKNIIKSDSDGIGSYAFVVQNVDADTFQSSVVNIEQKVKKDSYVNGYGEFLETVTSIDPLAKQRFSSYLSDWQWSGQKKDFYSYSAERAEQEKQFNKCYDAAIKKFGIGTAIIATTWVVSIIVPGGTIVNTSILVIAKATSLGALSGATFDGVFSAGKAIYQGKSTDEIIYETLNGAANGYLYGAVAGLIEGGVHVAILVKNAKRIADGTYILFGKKLYDKSGKIIRNLSEYSDDVLNALMKFLEQGDDIVKAIDRLSINYEELNKLRLALERGEISSAMFWEEVVKNGWSKDLCEELIKGNVDFGRYLRNLIGNYPSGMIDPHAHHILPKTGKGTTQQALVEEGQKILRSYGIDPILGPENLCWAPNRVAGQHSEEAIKEIVDGLKMLQEGGANKEEITYFLKVMGQKAAMRR
ncbi:MAG: AHH domain-containing protein [Treponema sp.]|nr:AHH domain-containing protein [Treponema sp.]